MPGALFMCTGSLTGPGGERNSPRNRAFPTMRADLRHIRLNRWLCVDKTSFVPASEAGALRFLTRPRRFGSRCGVSLLENYCDRDSNSRSNASGVAVIIPHMEDNSFATLRIPLSQVTNLSLSSQ